MPSPNNHKISEYNLKISTFETTSRLIFRKGWQTGGTDPGDGSVECGEDTDFPVEVTGASLAVKLSIIEEIFYRADTAQITQCDVLDWSPATNVRIYTGHQPGQFTHRVQFSDDHFCMQGYWAFDDDLILSFPASTPQTCEDGALAYLGDQYSVYTGNDADPVRPDGTMKFRDVAKEWGLWWFGDPDKQPSWNGGNALIIASLRPTYANFRCALSMYSRTTFEGQLPPPIPIPWLATDSLGGDPPAMQTAYEAWFVDVSISGFVAYTGAHPFDPAGKLYLGLRMAMHPDLQSFSSSLWFATYEFDSYGNPAPSITESKYIIRTSVGDISCRLYAGTPAAAAGDVVHEITKWWPYKTTAGDPAWDATTGEPANGGPAH